MRWFGRFRFLMMIGCSDEDIFFSRPNDFTSRS
jgi:hypothetical protein